MTPLQLFVYLFHADPQTLPTGLRFIINERVRASETAEGKEEHAAKRSLNNAGPRHNSKCFSVQC